MRQSIGTGLCFGLTSGIITTLGLIVGLNSATYSRTVVIGGIITIAVADAFSDALGIHISEESKEGNSEKHVWASTISTFVFKFIFAGTFLVPLLLFSLEIAVIASLIWGLGALGVLSFFIARINKEKAYKVITEHILIAVLVILITYLLGSWVRGTFI